MSDVANLEFYPAPGVLLSNEQTKQQLRGNQAAGQRYKAQLESEDQTPVAPPILLSLSGKQQPIAEQLSQRPGGILHHPKLSTSQQTIEIMPAPPPILLRGNKSVYDEPKPTSQESQAHLREHDSGVPSPPAILSANPVRSDSNTVGIRHNQGKTETKMCYNNFIYSAGGEQRDVSSR